MTDYSGALSGAQPVVLGHLGALGTTQLFVGGGPVWDNSDGLWTAGSAIEVISGSAADAAAGTGARTVRVYGAGTDGRAISEDFTMNGTTLVAGKKLFKTIYAIMVLTTGSGLKNAGLISARKNGETALITILAGDNFGSGAIWMVPDGTAYKVKAIRAGALLQKVQLQIYIYDATAALWYKHAYLNIGVDNSRECLDNDQCILQGGDVIRIDAISAAAGGYVDVQIVLERIQGNFA